MCATDEKYISKVQAFGVNVPFTGGTKIACKRFEKRNPKSNKEATQAVGERPDDLFYAIPNNVDDANLRKKQNLYPKVSTHNPFRASVFMLNKKF